MNFLQPNKRFVLSLRYNGSDSFLFVNVICQINYHGIIDSC